MLTFDVNNKMTISDPVKDKKRKQTRKANKRARIQRRKK